MLTKPDMRVDLSDVLSIGDMARRYGVSARALRFYEQRGLLQPTRVGSARFYEAQQRGRLAQILRGKQLGFTLTEIREMMAGDALALPPQQVRAQIDLLEKQRSEIDAALAQLQAVSAPPG